jgi:hypothetical protein
VIVMVSNATGIEVGLLAGKHPGRIGHLFSPAGERGPWRELPYGLDNGAWSAFKNKRAWDEAGWRRLLNWAALSGIRPLWAVVPDVVANRAATLELWPTFAPVVLSHGFRPAFAVQDGMTYADVPDDDCFIFLAGSTEWKLANIALWCEHFPGRVHVARVNTWERLALCWKSGAISVDGTGWFRKGNGGTSQFNELRKFLKETSHEISASA